MNNVNTARTFSPLMSEIKFSALTETVTELLLTIYFSFLKRQDDTSSTFCTTMEEYIGHYIY